jgi:hypothetical protein
LKESGVLRRAAWLILVLAVGGPGAACAQADAQPAAECTSLRVRAGSVLLGCGDRLKALSIAMNDIRRQPGVDPSGTFSFSCPIALLCADEPQITGWLIEQHRWTDSSRDEAAIFEIFKRAPSAPQGFDGAGAAQSSDCGLFDVQFAGLSGRGLCYRVASTQSNAVVVAAASREVGCLLVFYADGGDLQALREKVLTILPRFRMDVDTGDAGLMKWVR